MFVQNALKIVMLVILEWASDSYVTFLGHGISETIYQYQFSVLNFCHYEVYHFSGI